MNDVVDFWAVDYLKMTVILLSVFDNILICYFIIKAITSHKTSFKNRNVYQNKNAIRVGGCKSCFKDCSHLTKRR